MTTGKGGWTYITTTKKNTVLYTGVTSDLRGRIYDHMTKKYRGSFTAKYNADKLVWFEFHSRIESAIEREKQIKGWLRKKKTELIESMNPDWKDLYDELD
jgi:putative endonuclease